VNYTGLYFSCHYSLQHLYQEVWGPEMLPVSVLDQAEMCLCLAYFALCAMFIVYLLVIYVLFVINMLS